MSVQLNIYEIRGSAGDEESFLLKVVNVADLVKEDGDTNGILHIVSAGLPLHRDDCSVLPIHPSNHEKLAPVG